MGAARHLFLITRQCAPTVHVWNTSRAKPRRLRQPCDAVRTNENPDSDHGASRICGGGGGVLLARVAFLSQTLQTNSPKSPKGSIKGPQSPEAPEADVLKPYRLVQLSC